MKPSARRKKTRETGDDLWSWAASRKESPSVREDPPVQPGWYRGLLKKLSAQKDGS